MASNQLGGNDVNTPAASDSSSDIWSIGMERTKRGSGATVSCDSMELPSVEQPNHYHSSHPTRGKEVDNFDDVEVGRLINPFSKHDEEKLLKLRTHNRRRWSHVFPVGMRGYTNHIFIPFDRDVLIIVLSCHLVAALMLGEVEFKNIPGPWKSLFEPSLLPLTTDYLPVLLGVVARAPAVSP